MRPYLTWTFIALVLDQITKLWFDTSLAFHQAVPVMPSFNLFLAYNEGAAFSLLSDAGGWQRWFFITLAIGVSIMLVIWMRQLKPKEYLTGYGLGLILGGAIGNLIDRIAYGHVIDFIQLYWDKYYWPTFNIADSAIVLGVILMFADVFKNGFDDPKKKTES